MGIIKTINVSKIDDIYALVTLFIETETEKFYEVFSVRDKIAHHIASRWIHKKVNLIIDNGKLKQITF